MISPQTASWGYPSDDWWIRPGGWYRIPTLQHQLGTDLPAPYGCFVKNEVPYRFNDIKDTVDHEIGLHAEGQWRWVLANRFRLDTRMTTTLNDRRNPLDREAFRPTSLFSSRTVPGAEVAYRYDGTQPVETVSNFLTPFRFRVSYVTQVVCHSAQGNPRFPGSPASQMRNLL